ncbi:GvpL/GvpF family gas vesicle protein [Nocardiopsis changdeensis]|uniref:GvpL/GvpF family gas vesicle protein n=1 Tax=Nocardiopsis changdeensis TaxID=2831969 RepID=A0ABX8BLR9_9ACTN|nr:MULTISPECIES: GvpL/GvpF family gas vesicle protein [Nocardiopsis]QUX23190.1 GvpL/GvpF family gas vesicle protein [Nocardiopsis changdeensis]QYX39133.1 GvpL/GvpF family gas vesicle protein [Nocardiopsis sp. MT53]
MNRAEQASYAYAVCRPFDPGELDGLTGVGGHPVHLVTRGGLAAVISTVPAAEFDEQALRTRLEDLRWLEEVARAHHGVVAGVAARSVTAPLRLATVYRSDDRVREVLDENAAAFEETLDSLAGRVEFGVKVYAEAARPARAPEPAAPLPGESPGKAYLRRRREQRDRRDDTWEKASDLCERVSLALERHSLARVRHQPQNAALSESSGENVMNSAYLVDRGRAAEFVGAVEALAAEAPEGTRVEASGPWTPYSFASLRTDGEGT